MSRKEPTPPPKDAVKHSPPPAPPVRKNSADISRPVDLPCCATKSSSEEIRANCESGRHVFIANSGQGGKPVFKDHFGDGSNLMHVVCMHCNCRSFVSDRTWYAAS